ncbi:MAG: hypothetical protein LV480_09110 [Methylacidiphilales bacterium]|nr:hypothetical protein [Candidatus Methylacidiphilales bacterium]
MSSQAETTAIVKKKTITGYNFIVDDGAAKEHSAPTFMSRIPNPPSSVSENITLEERIAAIDRYVDGKRRQLGALIQ